ncbi:MAG TPA: response regulator [Bacteroidales bacterium]|nr:response regulator [Bacteroidales bacterium]
MQNQGTSCGTENINGTSFSADRGTRVKFIRYASLILSALLLSLILIMLKVYLAAGVLIILTALLTSYLIRKILKVMDTVRDSLDDISNTSEKKDDVITNFSHKIREPLNNLVIISDILMESGLRKKQKELVETFIASTKNMVTTVNELTMQSAGNLAYEKRKHIRFNLPDTIDNTIELYSLKENGNLDFIADRTESNASEYFGDPIIVKQILLDIFNTIESRYTGSNLKVAIKPVPEMVTDHENLLRIRIETDTTRVLIDDPANGEISLSVRLITACKGYFTREEGDGFTAINITLPFTKVPAETHQNHSSVVISEPVIRAKAHKELKNIRILLVEDNLINQKITLLTLQPLVHSIDTASDGREALAKFSPSAYDLILMDIQMPVMSGITATEEIRVLEESTSTHIPIIAITANAMIGDKEKCLAAGMDDYISKPFQPAVLIEKIKKLI